MTQPPQCVGAILTSQIRTNIRKSRSGFSSSNIAAKARPNFLWIPTNARSRCQFKSKPAQITNNSQISRWRHGFDRRKWTHSCRRELLNQCVTSVRVAVKFRYKTFKVGRNATRQLSKLCVTFCQLPTDPAKLRSALWMCADPDQPMNLMIAFHKKSIQISEFFQRSILVSLSPIETVPSCTTRA